MSCICLCVECCLFPTAFGSVSYSSRQYILQLPAEYPTAPGSVSNSSRQCILQLPAVYPTAPGSVSYWYIIKSGCMKEVLSEASNTSHNIWAGRPALSSTTLVSFVRKVGRQYCWLGVSTTGRRWLNTLPCTHNTIRIYC